MNGLVNIAETSGAARSESTSEQARPSAHFLKAGFIIGVMRRPEWCPLGSQLASRQCRWSPAPLGDQHGAQAAAGGLDPKHGAEPQERAASSKGRRRAGNPREWAEAQHASLWVRLPEITPLKVGASCHACHQGSDSKFQLTFLDKKQPSA